VVDGLVNEDVVRILVGWLRDNELLTVYGTAVDPTCKAVLSGLRRGSAVKKIPQSVLDDYRRKVRRTDGLDWPAQITPKRQPPAGVGGGR
jgi:adenine-specific DNA-methyltransferase